MNPLIWIPLEGEKSMPQMIKAAVGQGIKRAGLYVPENGAFTQWEKAFLQCCKSALGQGVTVEVLSLPLPVEKSQQIEITTWLSQASGAGVKTVVLRPGIPEEEFLEIQAASNAAQLCDQADKLGLSLLVETSGPLTGCKHMKNFLTCVGRASLKVAWNIHNTFLHEPLYRYPSRVVEGLAGEIAFVIVRDSLIKAGINEFRLLGFGNVPVLDSFKALKDAGVAPDVSFWMDRPSALGVDDALRHSIYVLHTVQKLV